MVTLSWQCCRVPSSGQKLNIKWSVVMTPFSEFGPRSGESMVPLITIWRRVVTLLPHHHQHDSYRGFRGVDTKPFEPGEGGDVNGPPDYNMKKSGHPPAPPPSAWFLQRIQGRRHKTIWTGGGGGCQWSPWLQYEEEWSPSCPTTISMILTEDSGA